MDETSQAVGHLQAEVDNLKIAVAAIAKDVTAIRTTLDEARGGGRVLLWLVGITSGFVGAAMVKFWHLMGARA